MSLFQRIDFLLGLLNYAVRPIGIAVDYALVGRPRLKRIVLLDIDIPQQQECLARPVLERQLLVGKGVNFLLGPGQIALSEQNRRDAVVSLGRLTGAGFRRLTVMTERIARAAAARSSAA